MGNGESGVTVQIRRGVNGLVNLLREVMSRNWQSLLR